MNDNNFARSYSKITESVTLRRMVCCLAATMLALACTANGANAAELFKQSAQPNVIFLLSDDQRPDTIGALGNSLIETPSLDRLVAEGLAFTRAVCPYPLCVPSRAEILTGCSSFHNGIYPGVSNKLDEKLILWPQAMASAGYKTCYVGKWHTAGRPSTRGYQESVGLYSGGFRNPPPQKDYRGDLVTGYKGWIFQTDDRKLMPEKGIGLTPNISGLFADAAISYIRRPHSKPFFLHVNFTAPHDPLLPPPGFENKYDPAKMPLPKNFRPLHPFDHGNARGRDEVLLPFPRTKEDVRADLAMYYAVISHLDQEVGRILDSLDKTGLAENTIVIYAGDHGLAMGSHGLRGKQNMYEHTVGIPLIIRGPGVPKGKKSAAQIYLRDIYPTICDLSGVKIPATVRSKSFAPVIRGQEEKVRDEVFCYFHDSQRMIRTDRWKLTFYPLLDRYQLFDLSADPDELRDLSNDSGYAKLKKELTARLNAWRGEVGDPTLGK